MKFLDSILGKSELPKAKLDKLFAISTACITLEANLDLKPGGSAGICFKPVESSRYEASKAEIEELLKYSCQESGTKYHIQKDEYNYLWVVLKDPDFEDLVTNVHLVSQTFIDNGFGEQLLCAVYRFRKDGPIYWIYNFKSGVYYPFAPLAKNQRDNTFEFRLRSVMESELPIEKNVEKWYPLWDMPL
ncbi:MAG: PspA-associated protein PspAB [Methanotrichaceae archaeon]